MTSGSRYLRFELVEHWAKLPQGWSFQDVGGITVDHRDRVHVLNRSEHPVMTFDRDGLLVNSWGEGLFVRAHGSCLGLEESLYCTDDGNHTVTRFTLDGEPVMTLGEAGRCSDTGYVETFSLWDSMARITCGAPSFNRPTGVSIGPNGDIYVADGYGNARIHRFSAKGELLASWGEPGGEPGCFRLPHSVRVDADGRVWVADRENNRIQIFNPDGGFIQQWTDLIRPTDLFIENVSGLVYVSELCNRISIFSTDGRLLARWGNPRTSLHEALLVSPHAICVDSHGDIYVGEVAWTGWGVDRGSEALHKFVRVT